MNHLHTSEWPHVCYEVFVDFSLTHIVVSRWNRPTHVLFNLSTCGQLTFIIARLDELTHPVKETPEVISSGAFTKVAADRIRSSLDNVGKICLWKYVISFGVQHSDS